MTVDELAREAGTTTRNIRAYQTRGLLPPPRVVGRTGYYDASHLARLRYIDRLQDRGFSLASIAELLQGWESGRSLSQVLGFEEALAAPWSDEKPEVFTAAQLVNMFPEAGNDPTLLERAVSLGLLVPEGEGWRAPSPRLMRAGADLVASGIPLSSILDHHALLLTDIRRIARRMVKLFEHNVWEPFVAAGLPIDQLPAITEALRRVRPTAMTAVQAMLAQAMEEAVAASTSEQSARLVEDRGRSAAQGNGSKNN